MSISLRDGCALVHYPISGNYYERADAPHWWSGVCWCDEEHRRQATVLLLGPPGWPE